MLESLAHFLARLTSRDQVLAALLALVLIPTGLAWGVILPLIERREAAQETAAAAEALQEWLIERRAELAALPINHHSMAQHAAEPVGLAGLEVGLIEADLHDHVSLLANTTGEAVHLRFDEVEFVAVASWLSATLQNSAYGLTALRLTRGSAAGMVTAEVQMTPRE